MVKAFIAGAMRESAAGSTAASRMGSKKRFMGPHIHNVAIVAILSRTRYHRVPNRFGGTTNGQHIPGANPGTDSQFPANCAGNLVSVTGLRRMFGRPPCNGRV